MDQFNDHLIVFLNEYGATVMGFVLAFLMALWRTAKVNGKDEAKAVALKYIKEMKMLIQQELFYLRGEECHL